MLNDFASFSLTRIHVVFGQVISGQEVIRMIESQKTDTNSRPYAEVKVLNCGELVPKSKGDIAYFFSMFKMVYAYFVISF